VTGDGEYWEGNGDTLQHAGPMCGLTLQADHRLRIKILQILKVFKSHIFEGI